MDMKAQDIRLSFLKFFEKRGHTIVPSSSLLSDDPSVLLTTAGMQQFKPYYSQKADPMTSPHPSLSGKPLGSYSVVSIQKSFRTTDIDEVGDATHLTFFEMLGNFSFGGYFKEQAITLAHEYFQEIGVELDFVTVFAGDDEAPKDTESEALWKQRGVQDVRHYDRDDNFWGPTGEEGPCGPCTELYVNGVEVWNLVFNEYYKKDGKYEPLKVRGVDTGMGFERLTTALQGASSVFETDLFQPLMRKIGDGFTEEQKRILADHSRASAFLLSDGVRPANKEAGYILRRLIRRALVLYYLKHKQEGASEGAIRISIPEFFGALFAIIEKEYGFFYTGLSALRIQEEFMKEAEAFLKTLSAGVRQLRKMDTMTAQDAFSLYERFGLPYEVIREIAPEKVKSISYGDFQKEQEKHREASKRGAEAKFGGHGLVLNTGELRARTQEEVAQVTQLHTATHLLQAALRSVLGSTVKQAGSDITAERLRFDFSFDRRLTDEEVQQVEALVNDYIESDMSVRCEEMPYEEAVKSGALYFEKETYPQTVKVYSIGEVSQELCGGPHIQHTGELKGFRIVKQESVSAGVRRIRAVVDGVAQ